MVQLYALAILPLLISVIWFCSARIATSLPTLRGKRICLLIAHPDDEAMFFAPTLLALTRPELGNHLKILCLSTGDADGLGDVRKKELLKSGLMLGLKSEDDIVVVDDPKKFPDKITQKWSSDAISSLLVEQLVLKEQTNNQSALLSTLEHNVDVIITFDSKGVSSHPNHISLNDGAKAFMRRMDLRREKRNELSSGKLSLALYALTSTNMLRKYLSIIDAPTTIMTYLARNKLIAGYPSTLLYIGGLQEYKIAQNTMTKAHKSQMIWFRWGWIGVSRYMVVNDLVKEEPDE